ncbi:unnamed protein product [Aureobasidium pullulans]|nr:unnamed protein product [Aureobasidium pullulans]
MPPDPEHWVIPESFQAGLNAREMAHIYHDSERDTNTDPGVSLTFSIESANGCAPRIRLTLELRRPEHALNSRSQQVPVHSGSIDLAFGHIFKKSNDESTTPNQIFNLKVDYAQEHSNAIISFDTTGATANNLKCLIDFQEGHDRVRNMPPAVMKRPRCYIRFDVLDCCVMQTGAPIINKNKESNTAKVLAVYKKWLVTFE